MVDSALPTAEVMAQCAVGILFVILAWDAFWLTRQRNDIPEIGHLPDGGFAWKSEGAHEMIRQWGNLGSMAAMMVLPWALLDASNTPVVYAIVWDVLLTLHLISLLIPKRYAITSTHLFADGQRYSWERLRLAKRQPKRRIMLLRNGWGPFGPLPLGGDAESLAVAREYIKAMEQARKAPLLNEEE